jgi:2-polyprenyl-3-methyl-5-hydroxy-6-metoxy-1,4-benzoquinol methylase
MSAIAASEGELYTPTPCRAPAQAARISQPDAPTRLAPPTSISPTASASPTRRTTRRGARGARHDEAHDTTMAVPRSGLPSNPVLPPALALRRAIARYDGQPLGIRAFVRARHFLTPLARILAAVPASGRVLDVGCGHGLFANALAIGAPARSVFGVDPSPVKIRVARASAAADPSRGTPALQNVRYEQAVVQDVAERGFDAIAILDVLYLLPVEEKLAILRACRERIASDGALVLKTNDTHPAWKYGIARLQERAMTGVGLTLGGHGLHFLSREQNAALLERAGFTSRTILLPTWLPYPHVMFVGRPA